MKSLTFGIGRAENRVLILAHGMLEVGERVECLFGRQSGGDGERLRVRVQIAEIRLGGFCGADQDDPALGLLACAPSAAHRVDQPGTAQPGVVALPLVGLVVDDDGPHRQVHPVGEGGGAGEVGQDVVADGLFESLQDLDGQARVVEADAMGQDGDERMIVAELKPDEVDERRQGGLLAEFGSQSSRELLSLVAGIGDD